MGTFSTTDRGTFKTCREQWNYVSLSRQGMAHSMPAKALLLGSLIHYTLADWLSGVTLDPADRFTEHFDIARLDILAKYAQTHGGAEMDAEEFEQSYGEPVGDLGAAMIRNYVDYYKQPLPSGYTLVAVEQPMTIDVPGTHSPTGEPHKLEATFDALIADPKGRILIVDHKTYERKPSQNELALNDQFLAYTWMGNQLNFGEVIGVQYNGLWKRSEPPKGRTRDDLFFRTMLPHARDEIENFGQRLAVELNEMGNNPAIYLNRAWYSCPQCPVQDICLAKTRGEEYDYLLEEFGLRERTPAWRAA